MPNRQSFPPEYTPASQVTADFQNYLSAVAVATATAAAHDVPIFRRLLENTEEAVATVIGSHNPALDISYPSLADPEICYIKWDENGAQYHTQWNHRSETFGDCDFREVLDLIQSRLARPMRWYPDVGCTSWRLVENAKEFYLNSGGDMPTASRARAADVFSFIIAYDPRTNYYLVHPPAAQLEYRQLQSNIQVFTTEHCSTLATAHAQAHSYAAQNRTSSSDNQWNVWPRKGSLAWRGLVRGVVEDQSTGAGNPTMIRDYAHMRQSLRAIIANPSAIECEKLQSQIVQFIWWKVSNQGTTPLHSSKKEKYTQWMNKWVRRHIPVEWVVAADDRNIMVHPVNQIKVFTEPDNYRAHVIYTATARSRNSVACLDCARLFTPSIVHKPHQLREASICSQCLEARGLYRCRHCEQRDRYHLIDTGCPRMTQMPFDHIYSYNTDVRSVIPKQFSTKADRERIKDDKGTMLKYGVELEVLRKSDTSKAAAVKVTGETTRKYAIIKFDSSIGPDGFEIVTAPATLNFHRDTLWNEFFLSKKYNGKTAAQFVHSWNSGVCGIHVHITRAAMTKMQLSKLLVFYHEDSNTAFLSRIAGRKVGPDAQYCITRKKKLYQYVDADCDDHHEAITISARNKGKTAEVRIFRGNATKHGVIRAIEFVDATVKWCGVTGANKLNYRDFLSWFDQADVRASYPDLWKHLMQLGYLSTKHKSKGMDTFDLGQDADRTA